MPTRKGNYLVVLLSVIHVQCLCYDVYHLNYLLSKTSKRKKNNKIKTGSCYFSFKSSVFQVFHLYWETSRVNLILESPDLHKRIIQVLIMVKKLMVSFSITDSFIRKKKSTLAMQAKSLTWPSMKRE